MSRDTERLGRSMVKLASIATEQRGQFNARCAAGMVRAVLQIRRPGLAAAAASASGSAGDRIASVFEAYGDDALIAMTDAELLAVLRGSPVGIRLLTYASRHYSPEMPRTRKSGRAPKIERSTMPVIVARCAQLGPSIVAAEMGVTSSYLRGAISKWRRKN